MSAAPPATAAPGSKAGRGALELLALCSFAVGQPLLGLLRDNATFFVARDLGPLGVVGFVAALLAAPPLVLWTIELVAGLAHPAARTWLHRLFVGLLIALLALPPLHRTLAGATVPLVLAAALGVAGAAVHARSAEVRAFLVWLALVPLVFTAYFLAGAQIRPLLTDAAGVPLALGGTSRTPVVVVLFDEFSTSSLMKPDGTIDERLFPSFARLAAGSTWFRNATSVLPMTEYVVPILLTGRYFEPGVRVPSAEAYPQNLFRLLGASHRIVAWESITSLCPQGLCDDLDVPPPLVERVGTVALDLAVLYAHVLVPDPLARRLPPVNQGWGGFWAQFPHGHDRKLAGLARRAADGMRRRDRNKRRADVLTAFGAFERFVDALEPRAEPTLYFLHVLLPHVPWVALPSGTFYEAPKRPDGQEGRMKTWTRERWPTDLAYQRYLLQLGYVDVLLGRLLDRLAETGLYDRCLLVVLADHGVTFEPGADYREPSERSLRDLMHVPLFVKLPFQKDGRISDRNVESVDVLPTILDALDADNPHPTDGQSALDSGPARPTKTMHGGGRTYTVDGTPPAEWPGLARKLELFGDGGRWQDVARMASRPGLVGRSIAEVGVSGEDGAAWSVESPERFADVDPASGFLPAYVRGEIRRAPGAEPADVAIGLNGTVWAVGRTFGATPDGSAAFAVLLPEEAFRAGPNEIEPFLVDPDGRLRRLTKRAG